ncbi:MAG: hypothetical protein ABGX25_06320 [Nautiliaceae bacterium]
MDDIIFFFGSLIIIAAFIWIVYLKFKDVEVIDFKEHKWYIIISTTLMLLSIYMWRIMYLIMINNFNNAMSTQKILETLSNG